VLLLDEITVDLDVLGRAELMQFLKEECEQRGATILYATHIFDGLEFWPSHIAYMACGVMRVLREAREVPELEEGKLLELVYGLLSEEADAVEKARGGPRSAAWDPSREGQVKD
jgi:CCR4-NOT complex subunit CAF16